MTVNNDEHVCFRRVKVKTDGGAHNTSYNAFAHPSANTCLRAHCTLCTAGGSRDDLEILDVRKKKKINNLSVP